MIPNVIGNSYQPDNSRSVARERLQCDADARSIWSSFSGRVAASRVDHFLL